MYDLDFEIKDKYDIDDLLEVTRILRSENGCPWDREQDHKSVRMNVLEEAYEVMEAIDADDAAMLKEELGDLLFQAVFHCEIEKERGRFEFNDICDDVTKKMIYRHPHVFGDVNVNNSDDVLKNWDKLKKKSKHQDTVADTLDSVPMVLPALMRGEKVFKRASNAGVALSGTSEAVDLVKEKLASLELAINDKNEALTEDNFGELLLSCCILSRFIKKDCEKALTFAVNKFIMRFRELESNTRSQGKTLDNLSDEQIKALFLNSINRKAISRLTVLRLLAFMLNNINNFNWRITQMTKAELVTMVAEKADLTKKDAEKAISALVESISETLAKGEKIQLVGFGTFEVRERAAREGVNPRTGDKIKIAASKVPAFKAGSALKDAVAK